MGNVVSVLAGPPPQALSSDAGGQIQSPCPTDSPHIDARLGLVERFVGAPGFLGIRTP